MQSQALRCLTIAMLSCIWTTLPARAAEPDVKIVALQINKKLDKALEQMIFGQTGVSMTMLVTLPEGKRAIGIDEDASKLTSFSDDKKTDLTKPASEEKNVFRPSWMSAFSSKISDDGRYVAIPIQSAGVTPAAGAREIVLNASVCILCGANEKSAEQKDVALKEGTKLTLGPIPMTIGKVEEAKWGGAKLNVPLKSSQRSDAIKSIEFIDASGKPIESSVVGRMSTTFGKMANHETTYGLKAKADVVTVKVTYFEKVEKVNVPVDLKVGVGLP